MKVYIILCTGFAQSARRESGFDKVRRALQKFSSPNVEVIRLEWDSDFVGLAARIVRDLNGAPAAFVVAGYSYGGFLANKFCEEMQKHTMFDGNPYQIDHLILVDAVARFWVRFPQAVRKTLAPALRYVMTWWSVIPTLSIEVPPNVEAIDVFRQVRTLPRGHAVKRRASTELLTNKILDVPHVEMDDVFVVKHTIIMRADKVVRMWKGTDGV